MAEVVLLMMCEMTSRGQTNVMDVRIAIAIATLVGNMQPRHTTGLGCRLPSLAATAAFSHTGLIT